MRVHMLVIDINGTVERSDYIDMPGSDLTREACKAHAFEFEGDDDCMMNNMLGGRGHTVASSIVVELAQNKPWTWRKVIYTVA
jgi:hypothetical protein